MKKLYSEAEYRKQTLRIQKKQRRDLEHENRRSQDGRKPEYSVQINKKTGRFEIEAPAVFSIQDNADSMLNFFGQIYAAVKKKVAISFDLSGVTTLNADAILYMLSVFDYYGSEHGFHQFSGNYPDDTTCRDYLISSGFFKNIHHSKPATKPRSDILSVRNDSRVHGPTADNVINFALKTLGKTRGIESKQIYGTLIECMGNTRNHAHLGSNHDHRKWWLMARYDEKDKRINFSFLDNGTGIPKTVKLNFYERFRESAFGNRDDAALILSALRGELRTRTGKKWRGTGLPQILDFSKKQVIDNLVVISNRGRVNASTESPISLTRKFYGTMLSWDFV
jgi:hypothetical protein